MKFDFLVASDVDSNYDFTGFATIYTTYTDRVYQGISYRFAVADTFYVSTFEQGKPVGDTLCCDGRGLNVQSCQLRFQCGFLCHDFINPLLHFLRSNPLFYRTNEIVFPAVTISYHCFYRWYAGGLLLLLVIQGYHPMSYQVNVLVREDIVHNVLYDRFLKPVLPCSGHIATVLFAVSVGADIVGIQLPGTRGAGTAV